MKHFHVAIVGVGLLALRLLDLSKYAVHFVVFEKGSDIVSTKTVKILK